MSNANRAENTLENRLINKIVQFETILRDMTTPQPIGGDVLKVITVPAESDPPVIIGPINIPPVSGPGENFANIAIELEPGLPVVTGVTAAMFIGGFDAAHHWPEGSSLTGGQRSSTMTIYDDEFLYDTVTGKHTIIIALTNFSGATPHNFWVTLRLLVPKLASVGLS